jgi:transglutaminase-like putative cysteine protease
MRAWGLSLVLIGSLSPALAEDAPPVIAVTVPAASTAPYDVVRQFIDIQVMEDGSYLKGEELAYRVRDAQGVTALQQVTLSFTQGFQDYRVVSAYTLKADGARIEVPRERMLLGHGASSLPGFQDENNLTIFFPNVEIGDQVVLRTIFRQDIPWYEGNFAATFPFTRTVVVEQARLQVSAPSDLPVMISSTGMQGGAEQIIDGQKRWIWTYSNDLPLNFAQDSVVEIDADPHVALTTFANYAEVAEAYAERSEDKSAVTPEIQALADALTEGVTDEREQVRILYHWVASQISYVAIFLGAGGFTPHEAGEILANRYGDCKDHVVLLEALLAAKGIESTAVLINLGSEYEILDTPSPFYFNHVITYVPSIDLYLDSTSPMAPFGCSPSAPMAQI